MELQREQQYSSSHFHSPALPRTLPHPARYTVVVAAAAVGASPSVVVYLSEPHALSLGVVEEEGEEPEVSGCSAHNAFGLNGDEYVATFLASKWEILGVILRSRSLGSQPVFLFSRWQGEVVNSSETRLCDSRDIGV